MSDSDIRVLRNRRRDPDVAALIGPRYDNDDCLVFQFAAGKITEIREYCDSVLTEKALGKVSGTAETSGASHSLISIRYPELSNSSWPGLTRPSTPS